MLADHRSISESEQIHVYSRIFLLQGWEPEQSEKQDYILTLALFPSAAAYALRLVPYYLSHELFFPKEAEINLKIGQLSKADSHGLSVHTV